MNKDGHSIFEKYKNTSAKQQIVEEGMRDVLKSRNEQVITEVEAVKKTVKMSYGDFLAKYKKSIAKHTADFIDDDPENEDEAEQMAVDAVIDDLEHQGIHVEFIDVKLMKPEDDEAGDPKHPDYAARKELLNKRKYDKVGSGDHPLFANQKNFFNSQAQNSALKIKDKYGVGGWANKKF